MPAAVTMPFVITVYGAASIAASMLAFLLAGAKRREAQSWAFWSFLFPPVLLALLLVRRRSTEEARQHKLLKAVRRHVDPDD